MKFIDSHEKKISKESVESLFNKKGEPTDGIGEKVFSKSLGIDLGDKKVQNRYFIRVYNNMPLDPYGPEANRDIWNRTELKQVSNSTFESYNNYLSTRNKIFWTKANRSFING